MRQAIETVNPEKFSTSSSNSAIYIYLKRLTTQYNPTVPPGAKILFQCICTALLKGEDSFNLSKRISGERRKKIYNFNPLTIKEAKTDLEEIKRLRKLSKAHPLIPGSKKLERYHSEILTLHQAKASYRDIQFWLLSKKRLKVSHHTIQRYIQAINNEKEQN